MGFFLDPFMVSVRYTSRHLTGMCRPGEVPGSSWRYANAQGRFRHAWKIRLSCYQRWIHAQVRHQMLCKCFKTKLKWVWEAVRVYRSYILKLLNSLKFTVNHLIHLFCLSKTGKHIEMLIISNISMVATWGWWHFFVTQNHGDASRCFAMLHSCHHRAPVFPFGRVSQVPITTLGSPFQLSVLKNTRMFSA